MEKILLGLAVLFLTITGLFYYFLSSFNVESRRQSSLNRIAGTKIEKITAAPTPEKQYFPTKNAEEFPTATPTPELPRTEWFPIGNLPLDGQIIEIGVAKEYMGDEYKKPEGTTIPFADFSLVLKLPSQPAPGSDNNKFIFGNKEYAVRIFSVLGTETGFAHQPFFAEKTGREMAMLMYKIDENSIIINRETGWWEGGVQVAIGVSDMNEFNEKNNVVRFYIE